MSNQEYRDDPLNLSPTPEEVKQLANDYKNKSVYSLVKALNDAFFERMRQDNLQTLNHIEEHRRAFIKNCLDALERQKKKRSFLSNVFSFSSDTSFYLTSIAGVALIILGTVFGFEAFGLTSGWETGLACFSGGMIAAGVTYNALMSRQFKSMSTAQIEKSKIMRQLARNALIMSALSLVLAGIFIQQAASALSLGTPFGLAGALGQVFVFSVLGLATITGFGRAALNYSMYEKIKNTTRQGKEEGERIKTSLIDKPMFKHFILASSMIGSVATMALIGILVMSVVPPPGLGLALGLLIGAASVFKKYISVRKKIGGLNPDFLFDRMLLKFEAHFPIGFKVFNGITTVLASATLVVAPIVGLPALVSKIGLAIPSIIPLVVGIITGVLGGLANLRPGYNATTHVVNQAQCAIALSETKHVEGQLQLEEAPRSSAYRTQQILGAQDHTGHLHHSDEPKAVQQGSAEAPEKRSDTQRSSPGQGISATGRGGVVKR